MDEAQAKLELAKASDNDSDYAAAIAKVGEENSFAFEEMARVRKETVEAKLPYAIEYIKEQLETLPKVVVFAHHHLAIEGFAKAFPLESVSIYGEIRPEDRQKAIDRFQNDPNCRIAIVSIMAGGVGITLTAASHVYFIELDWVPGNVTQCEDRCHRIGQQDAVNVYHLVLRGSIDVKMANTIISKQKIIEAALDKIMEREPVTLSGEGATKKSSRKAISEEAEMLTAGDIESIHADLKFLAEHDQDHAQFHNGIGFNAIDGRIGHELAERQRLTAKQAALGKMILRKYKRQLGKDDEK
jgi:SNF2 family DNA or RNA helicase